MAEYPRAIRELAVAFERLPGIGPKTAARLAFYLLTTPQDFNDNLARVVTELKKKIKICHQCFNWDENDPCSICRDAQRQKNLICVVERAIDVLALENVGGYQGRYHVLGGAINPLEHVGPQELRIDELIERLAQLIQSETEMEVILATNPTMEGEATALYIKKRIEERLKKNGQDKIKISRIGSGLPMGADMEYADQATLARAMEGRREL